MLCIVIEHVFFVLFCLSGSQSDEYLGVFAVFICFVYTFGFYSMSGGFVS